MKYYQYVDVDHKGVLNDLQSYIIKNIGNLKGFWSDTNLTDLLTSVPNLPSIFEPLNLTIQRVSVIVLSTKVGSIHVDEDLCSTRINLPIFNCDTSETRFFVNHGIQEHRYLDNGIPYLYIDPSKCEHVDTLILNKPAALNVAQPHQVIAGEQLPRISLTIRFNENIDHLLND